MKMFAAILLTIGAITHVNGVFDVVERTHIHEPQVEAVDSDEQHGFTFDVDLGTCRAAAPYVWRHIREELQPGELTLYRAVINPATNPETDEHVRMIACPATPEDFYLKNITRYPQNYQVYFVPHAEDVQPANLPQGARSSHSSHSSGVTTESGGSTATSRPPRGGK